jgi:hypothetical protein
MIKTVEYVEESGNVLTYGVCCREAREGQNHRQVKYHVIPNISTKPAFVEELVNRLVTHNADPVHLMELIADYLP